MEIFARPPRSSPARRFCAKSRLALARVRMLRVLRARSTTYRSRLEALSQHPDHDLFGSLPGAGLKMPRDSGRDRLDRSRFKNPSALQCREREQIPPNYQSGQLHKVYLRRQLQ